MNLRKIPKQSLNRFLAITYASFWATIIIMRSVEFIDLLFNHYPAIIIDSIHIHHFVTGFIILFIVFALQIFTNTNNAIKAILFGTGLGLAADEFLYWTLGRFNYWSYANFFGTILIGIILLVAIYLTLEYNNIDADFLDLFDESELDLDQTPLVSIVIPAHNEELFISSALRSLQRQTYTNFEIIVVDNNSTDSTVEIAKSFNATILREEKLGVIAARQAGFLLAKGEIIATLDADTIAPPEWLERIVKKFNQRPEMAAYGGMYTLYSGPLSARIIFPDIAYLGRLIDRIAHGVWSLPGTNLAVRKEAFLKIGGFDATKKGMGGIDISRRISKLGSVVMDYGHLVSTSGRRYNKGLTHGLFHYAATTKAGKLIPLSKKLEAIFIREEKHGRFSFLFPLLPAIILFCLFALRAPAVAEAQENTDSIWHFHQYEQTFREYIHEKTLR